VYLKNIDIWGFLTVYHELFEILVENNSGKNDLLAKIKKIVLNALFDIY
jgi:hypothetical protein